MTRQDLNVWRRPGEEVETWQNSEASDAAIISICAIVAAGEKSGFKLSFNSAKINWRAAVNDFRHSRAERARHAGRDVDLHKDISTRCRQKKEGVAGSFARYAVTGSLYDRVEVAGFRSDAPAFARLGLCSRRTSRANDLPGDVNDGQRDSFSQGRSF